MLQNNKDQIVCYHEHDSLLDHKEEEALTEEDRKAAWAEYEAEKKVGHWKTYYTSINKIWAHCLQVPVLLENIWKGHIEKPVIWQGMTHYMTYF